MCVRVHFVYMYNMCSSSKMRTVSSPIHGIMSQQLFTSESELNGGASGAGAPNPPGPPGGFYRKPVILCISSSSSSQSDSGSETEIETEQNLPKVSQSVFSSFYGAVGGKQGFVPETPPARIRTQNAESAQVALLTPPPKLVPKDNGKHYQVLHLMIM